MPAYGCDNLSFTISISYHGITVPTCGYRHALAYPVGRIDTRDGMTYDYDDRERLFSGHTGRLFLLITAIWFCVSLTSRLIPPLLPAIIDELMITAFLAGVALTAERIIKALIEYPSGRFADQYSRTTVLIGCIAFVIVGVLILAGAVTYALFVLGVVVFGIGRGMYTPAARALVSDMFRQKRGRAFGINMLGSEFAGIVGAGLAIVIVGVATWRAAFLPLALLLLPLLVAFYVLSREPIRYGYVELGVRDTSGRVFGDPTIRLILLVYSLYVLAASGVSTFLPLFLIEVHGVSFALASAAFGLLYLAGLVAKPVGGVLSDLVPRLYVAGGGLLIGVGGLAVLILAPTGAIAILGVLVYALGYRGIPPSMHAFLMDRFPDENMAGDLGAMRTVYLLIGSLGPAYAGFAANTIGFVPAFVNFLLFYLIGAATLLYISITS